MTEVLLFISAFCVLLCGIALLLSLVEKRRPGFTERLADRVFPPFETGARS